MKINVGKKLLIWMAIILVFIWISDCYIRNIDSFSKGQGYQVASSIDILLGIPQTNGKKSDLSKISEILHISEEEWESPACEAIDKLDCSTTKPGEKCKTISRKGLDSLKDCISISNARIIQPYCNHWRFKDCFALSINDYILERTDIFNKIVEILQKPCQYFPTEENLINAGKIPDSLRSVFYDARGDMNCSSKEIIPNKMILKVYDKHREHRFDIVINRKE